jgi:ketosteroid isomerase-like protein
MSTETDNIDTARRYLAAVGRGAAFEELAEFFTPDVIQVEYPNRLAPAGASRDLAQLRDAAERGRNVVTAQSYEVRNAVAGGPVVALEVVWTATLKVPFGTIPAGGHMQAHLAIFLEFRDGKIATQRNYDCYEPW